MASEYQLPYTGAQVEALMNTVNALADWAKASEKPTYTADEVGARPSTWLPSASEVGADPVGTAASAVSSHNTAEDAHEDIRLLITGLTSRLNALADSDDTTLDQVSELVAYIKANRSLIEQVTTGKVSVSDIVDNLTTNVSNKTLSAAQGVALKALIDAITVPTKISQLENDSGYLTEHQDLTPYAKTTDLTAHTGNSTVHVTAEEKAAWNGKSNFSGSYNDLSDKPTIPTVPTKVSELQNDAGYLTQHQDISGKIDKPASGVVGQVLAVKTVDENGKPTEFACVYQTSGGSSGSGGEIVETTFKVLPSTTTQTAGENDIVLSADNPGFLNRSGEFTTSNGYQTSDYLQINEDATIYGKYLMQYASTLAIAFYDKNKAFISGGSELTDATAYTGNIAVPSGSAYARVTVRPADPNMYCQITTRETVVTDSLGTQVGFLEADVATLKTQVSELTNEVDSTSNETETFDYSALSSSITSGYYDTSGVLQSTTGWRCTNFIPVSEGDKLTVKLTTYNTTMAIAYFDENKEFVSGVIGATWSWSTSVYPLSGEQVVPAGAYFVRISVFIADYATEQYVTINRATIKNIQHNLDIINGKPLNVLILGDSYSEMGRWVNGMKEVIDIKNLVNLGVSSATLKDRYADRTSYPYSSRPDKADGSGNTNTLSSQIQKLKRLMAGTDLDSGESQIYASESDYPDVIIIEGGMNDAPDSDEVVATYHNQFMVSKNAYYKANSSASVTQTTVWVKPSLDTIDRTCFAGAYRYLCEELITLFPNAQIFLTTASHMNYFTVNPNDRYGKIAEQQRKCADIMSYTVIDWHAEGNLNTMMIGLNGSGTESDPYTPVDGNEYTTDLLHPNDKGGRRYGRLAGNVIAQKFLGFY